ncbi:MAG: hypothetical protein OEY09_16735, partial [Gammaproteobacteria bacterium]|nr:hypothetical protein [Gammaproteobacteria bacterium]
MIENPDKFNLRIRNIEVVQTVQNTLHDVPLIAGKRTYVRVYIAPDPSIAGLPIAGELCAINDACKVTSTFPAIEHSQLDQEISTHQQRLDWSRSLNFLLPQNFWDCSPPAPISFELTRAWCIAPNGERVEFTNIADEENNTRVDFVKDPEMHCRIVIYRYQDGDNQRLLQPGSGEVAAIQHRVENIFPVAAVNWSSIIISAPDEFRALEAISQNNTSSDEQTTLALVKLFNHLQVIREQDILHGRDPGTLYLGLLSDPTGRLGGAAMDSPQFAAPHTVAISSTDSDGQLGAHELAHALGCRHPGIPDIKLHGRDIGQRRETDAENHSLHGYLSENLDTSTGEIHLGLDARYGTASPAVLAHDQYFDLMTYRHPQWISAVTYSNLHRRLQESRKANYSINPKASKYWTVIGEYDLIRKTGRIHYLGPTKYLTPVPESINQPLLKLAWHIDEFGSRQAEVPVYIKDLEKLDGSRSIGVFQHTLTTEKELKSLGHTIDSNGPLKLLIGELVVDQIGGQDIETTSNAIDELISQLVSRRQTSEPSLLALSYSVEDDAYYIDYQWPEKLVGHLRLTTSLACQRGGQKD